MIWLMNSMKTSTTGVNTKMINHQLDQSEATPEGKVSVTKQSQSEAIPQQTKPCKEHKIIWRISDK